MAPMFATIEFEHKATSAVSAKNPANATTLSETPESRWVAGNTKARSSHHGDPQHNSGYIAAIYTITVAYRLH